MKFRPYGKFGKKDKKTILLVSVILGILIPYLAGGFYLLWHLPYEATMAGYDIDRSQLIDANYTAMAGWADEFNLYYENNNTPLDYVLTVYWNDTSYTNITRYGTAGDATIWTGMMLMAQSLHYAAAVKTGVQSKIDDALRLAERALRGVSILMAVPSGGIGEGYPAMIARSVTPKNWTEVGGAPVDAYDYENPEEMDADDIFEGTGAYSDWWWKGYPSTDQWSGIFLGLGQCARVFMQDTHPETQWIRTRVRDLAIQIIEGFIRSNWMILDQTEEGNSRTTGQDFKLSIEMAGIWLLSILKMGMAACPERYTDLYYHYALERNYINIIEHDLRIFNLMNFYSFNINYNMLVNLVSLEEDPSLRIRYENIVTNIWYPIIRLERNAWFNTGYLYMMQKSGPTEYTEADNLIVEDIEDQMMRFNETRLPNNTTRIPERGGDQNPVPYEYYNPIDKYVENPIINLLYGWVLSMINKSVYEYAKTTDMYHSEDFFWQRTPWEIREERASDRLRQDSGLAYLLPYYIGRYLNIFSEEG